MTRESRSEAVASDALHANLRTLRRAGVQAEPQGSYIIAFAPPREPVTLVSAKSVRRFLASLRGAR